MLELVDTMETISAKHDFDLLSYLLSLSRIEIMDILNYATPARSGLARARQRGPIR